MADYGVTPSGFVIKRLPVIKQEIEDALRAALGNGINLLPTEFLGQMVGILAEREALIWELAKAVYDSFFPDTANGVNLDNVVAITGIKRLEATKGEGQGIAYGTLGTIIPAGSVVSVDGNPAARFLTTAPFEIAAGTDAVQLIQFSAVPDAGDWTVTFDGEEIGTLAFSDNAAALEAALEAIGGLSSVTVTGNYTSGFEITYTGADGQKPQPLLRVGVNTLTNTSVQVTINISEDTAGVLPNVTCDVIAETAGNIPAYANTLTVIESPFGGWESFNNLTDITAGKNIETDAEMRLRRIKTLATAGAATLDAIRARLLEIDEVTDARVFENDTDITDIYGRPPHSIECVVLGGDEQEIADTIWATKAAGIATTGDLSETVLDSMSFTHTVEFSRPTPIPIYILVDNLITDPLLYPIDGDNAIKEAIVAFADPEFGIGDDVIYNKIFCPIAEIAGVIDFDLTIDVTAVPAATANISIADDEVAVFDTSTITVSV